ncbi:MAG: glycosyltransferase, partial [Prolixibacteraceae bacterium]
MSKTNQKRIIVSVTNDLVADNRVHKVCTTLTKLGFSVLLVGRKLPNSPSIISGKYQMKRFRLLFQRGPFFYAEFNVRLFLFLLFTKCDVYLSNDLDTLPANFFASKIRKSPLVYDSHEYFTEVPELIHRPGVQKIWQFLEKSMVPRIKYAYTVSESIAKNYRKKYGTQFQVV